MRKNIFWPEINDLWTAKKACIQASSGAFVVAIVTGAVTYFQVKGTSLLSDVPSGSYIDAAVFFVLGFLIYRCSRIASIAGLLIYIYGQVLLIPQMHRVPVMPILLSLFFIGGVRGAFVYQEMKKGLSKEEIKAAIKEQKEESDPSPSLKKRIIAWVILVLLGGAGFWFYKKYAGPAGHSNSQVVIEDAVPEPPSKKVGAVSSNPKVRALQTESKKQTIPEKPLPGEEVFKLKNGQTITGRVIMDDPVYYTVETSSGRQEIVIKEDLAR